MMSSRAYPIAVLALALAPAMASANDGTPAWIHALIQEGDDVKITLRIADNGEPGIHDEYTLTRKGAGDPVVVVQDTSYGDVDATSIEGECRGSSDDSEHCTANPGDCIDCNDDSVVECLNGENDGWCEDAYYIDIVDDCVPPGETEYELTSDFSASFDDSETITVTGDGCSGDSDSDADTDADTDADADSDPDDGVGCSATRGSTSAASSALRVFS